MNKNKIVSGIVGVFSLGIVFLACQPQEAPQSGISITLAMPDSPENYSLGFPSGRVFESVAGPSTASSFDCFAVNVTGENIPIQNNNCTAGPGGHWNGTGIRSPLVRTGGTINFSVRKGPARKFDAYGINPSTHISECGGSGTNTTGNTYAYFMGTVTSDVFNPISLTIPLTAYTASAEHDLACPYGSVDGVEIAVTGVNHKAYAVPSPTASSCAHSANPNPSATPTANPGTQPADYTVMNTDDAQFMNTACGYATGNAATVYFSINLANLDLTTYPRLRLKIQGAMGQGTAATAACLVEEAAGTGGSNIQIWDASLGTPSWVDFDNIPTTQTSFFRDLTFAKNLVTYAGSPTGTAWIRIVGRQISPSKCSFLRVNLLKLFQVK